MGDIGGPSAGMMFALGIVDKLTPDSLTGGRFVAGTGEISVNGAVSPIGGIQQKMAGARAAGSDDFPHPGGQLPGCQRGGAGRPAPGQGGHAAPGDQRAGRDQGGPRFPGC